MRLYCGIDLHANNHYLVILDPAMRVRFEQRQRNDLALVLATLEPFRAQLEAIAVESTYNWYWLVDGLQEAGYRVRLVNPSKVRQYEGLKHRDDRHDARWLAHLLALGILPTGYIYDPQERPWRDLLRRRGFLVRKRTSHLLALRAVYERQTGHRVSTRTAQQWTSRQIETLVEDSRVALEMSALLSSARVLTAQVRRIEKQVLPAAELREEFQLLRTVGGIGEILALTIMYEVGDIGRFSKVGRFASYCRCVATRHTSDGKKKGQGNRRNGNRYLSWAFSEAAHFARRYQPGAQRFYARKLAKSHPMVAARALANKLARACFYILRDQVPFDSRKAFG